MKRRTLSMISRSFIHSCRKHSPEILVALGITGLISAIGLAISETPTAIEKIDEVKEDENKEELTTVEVVKATWKCYVPMVLTGAIGVTCIIFASSINHRRNLALSTACALSESALSEYSAKVAEKIGVKKEKEIRDSIAKDRIDTHPTEAPIVISSQGGIKCFDMYNNTYFESNIDIIKRGVNQINFNMNRDGYATLNDFYYEIGAKPVQYGDDLGWNICKGLLDVHYSSVLDEDSRPCLAISFIKPPMYDYDAY